MSNELYFDLGRIKELKDHIKAVDIGDEANQYLSMLEGAKFRFVKDPKILSQLDLSENKIQRPEIKNSSKF